MYVPIELVRTKMADYQREAEEQRQVAAFRRARAPTAATPERTPRDLHQRIVRRIVRRLAIAFRLAA